MWDALGGRRTPTPGRGRRSGRWLLLVPLIIPVFSLELGQEDIGATAPDDHRAPGLRPDHRRVRGRLQRAAAGRVRARPAGDAERRVHPEVRQGAVAEGRARAEAEGAAEAAEGSSSGSSSSWRPSSRPLEDAAGRRLEAEQASLEQQADAAPGAAGRARGAGRGRCRPSNAASRPSRRRLEPQACSRSSDGPGRLAGRIRPLARELARLGLRERVLAASDRSAPQGNADPGRAAARPAGRGPRAPGRGAAHGCAPLDREARRLADAGRGGCGPRPPGCSSRPTRCSAAPTTLQRQKTSLQQQAAELQREGDQLQQQADVAAAGRATSSSSRRPTLQQQADDLKAQQEQAAAGAEAGRAAQEAAHRHGHHGRWRRARHRPARREPPGGACRPPPECVALTPPQINKTGDVVLLSAVPSTAPASDDTADLRRARARRRAPGRRTRAAASRRTSAATRRRTSTSPR